MRVLVIGSSGAVGGMILPSLAERYDIRQFDPAPPGLPILGEHVTGSVSDPGALRNAMSGCDAIVYLAMGTQRGWGVSPEWAASAFDVNVTGLHLTLWLAAEAGIKRMVHTSSASVFENYRAKDHASNPIPDADDTYGLSKRLGEQVCEAASRRDGTSITALRLVGPMPDEEWQRYDGPHRGVVTAGTDVARAYLAALDNPLPGFNAFLVTGDVDMQELDWSATETALGWQPRARVDTKDAS